MTAAPEEAGLELLMPKPEELGFTLIELMISLALFALISLAGVALVESLMSIQQRTDGRLARVADIQRAAFVIANDVGQITAGQVQGAGDVLSFNRPIAAIGGLPVRVGYRLDRGVIVRSLDAQGRRIDQRVLTGVASLRWRFYGGDRGWSDQWPAAPELADQWPAGIAADIRLVPGIGVDGTVRRVVLLPAKP